LAICTANIPTPPDAPLKSLAMRNLARSLGVEAMSLYNHVEWLLGRMREAGFSPELTYHAYHALDGHILGFTLWQLGHSAGAKQLAGVQDFPDLAATFLLELRAGDYPYLAEHVEQHIPAQSDESGSEFEFGLGLILDGLKRAR
jgi:hypothetical protein